MEPGILRMIKSGLAALDAELRQHVQEQCAESGSGTVLPGTVFAFSGTLGGNGSKHPVNAATGEVDTGYALCDGETYAFENRVMVTPNLSGRFILASGGGYSAGQTGGSATFTPTVTISATTLTAAQMPSHNHTYSVGVYTSGNAVIGIQAPWEYTPSSAAGRASTNTGSGNSHTHTLTNTAGASLPPYYALAYIMKL